MYRIRLPIGDWSNDGHGMCDYYVVKSNKSVEELREIHFQIENKTGINIHKICNKHDKNTMDLDDLHELKEIGFDISDIGKDEKEGVAYFYSNDMRDLWMFLLMKTDDSLLLEKEANPEMLPFFGFDDKQRHISFVGYGCF